MAFIVRPRSLNVNSYKESLARYMDYKYVSKFFKWKINSNMLIRIGIF
jgi:hypothetical protein